MKTALILINLLITFTHEAIIIIQNKLRSYSFLQVPIIINHSDIHNLEQANIQEGVIAGISSDSLVTFFDQSNSINSPVFIFDHSDDRKINNQSISITDYTNMRQFQGYIVNSGRNNVSQISQDSIDINLKYIYRDIKMEWIKNTAFSYVFENHYLHTI